MSLIGLSFPFRKESGEFPVRDYDQEVVRSNVIALFNLPLGSRVMRPELGTTVYDMVFDSTGALMEARLQRSIRSTLERGEPRAQVESISITTDNTKVICDIVYSVTGIIDQVTVELPTV